MAQKVTPEQLLAIIRERQKSIIDAGRELVREYGDQGAYNVYERVVELDRIDTSDMLESAKSDYKELPDGAESRYGFLDGPAYTTYQEHGTEKISAMNAVEDTAMNINVDFDRAVDAMLRREWGS